MLEIYNDNLNKTAIIESDTEYTYEEFRKYVYGLRDYLTRSRYRRIAIVVPNGLCAYVAMWASYLSGGVFCVVNPEYPALRIKQCIADFRADIVFDTSNLDKDFLDSIAGSPFGSNSEVSAGTDDIAYVLMTSGSTGESKGVCIYRDAFEEVIEIAISIFDLGDRDIAGQYSNVSFDMGICDVFSFFSKGVTVIPVLGMERLRPATVISKYHITFWYSVPTILDFMDRRGEITSDKLKSLRAIAFGGAVLYEKYVRKLFEVKRDIEVINTYGPTEITIFCSAVSMHENDYRKYCDGGAVCIGYPIDSVKQEMDNGSDLGTEVVIVGRHVMAGYLSRISDGDDEAACLDRNEATFHTGDIVREKDGALYFVARNDSQIKINGNRVDLTGIEAIIRSLDISNCVVMENEGRLLAFIAPKESEEKLGEIKSCLKERLPRYSIPDVYIFLDEIPLNGNGKYDRQRLKAVAKAAAGGA